MNNDDILTQLFKENQRLSDTLSATQADLVQADLAPNKATLYAKKSGAMKLLGRIEKKGVHQQGWKYATAEDVKDAVRKALAEVGLSLSFEMREYEITRNGNQVSVLGKIAFTLECGESGATDTQIIIGEAAEFNKSLTADKVFYKLYTSAEKYFLRTTFLISSGEDLDSDQDNHPATAKQEPQQKHSLRTLAQSIKNTPGYSKFPGTAKLIEELVGRPAPAQDDAAGWRIYFEDGKISAFEWLEKEKGIPDEALEKFIQILEVEFKPLKWDIIKADLKLYCGMTGFSKSTTDIDEIVECLKKHYAAEAKAAQSEEKMTEQQALGGMDDVEDDSADRTLDEAYGLDASNSKP